MNGSDREVHPQPHSSDFDIKACFSLKNGKSLFFSFALSTHTLSRPCVRLIALFQSSSRKKENQPDQSRSAIRQKWAFRSALIGWGGGVQLRYFAKSFRVLSDA